MEEQYLTTEEGGGEQISQRLNHIERDMKEIQRSIKKMQQFMFWRLVVTVFFVVVPLIILPFVLLNVMGTYLTSFDGLL